jgi:hypothetical protein
MGRYNLGTPDLFSNGRLDEVRISTNAMSGDWILTRYNMESDNDTFLTITDPNMPTPPPVQWRIFGDEGLVA